MTDKQKTFNPNEHLMQIKNSKGSADYLPVQWRLVWFNEQCPEGKITILEKIIDTEREVEKEISQWNNETRRSEKVVKRARGWAYFHMRVEDGKGKVGEAVKSECAVDFDDYIEKADTGATGRALAKIGYGTQFAPELDEQHRIVDAPVDRGSKAQVGSQGRVTEGQQVIDAMGNMPVTEQQLASLEKLALHLRKQIEKMPATYGEAKEMIRQLSAEYNAQKRSGK